MSVTETMRPKSAPLAKEQGVPRLRLLYTPGMRLEGPPRVYRLQVGRTHLGRELGNGSGIELPQDNRASRIHACIDVAPSDLRVRITDQGSKNGTSINRSQLAASSSQPLSDGDIVRIGDSFLILRHESEKPLDANIPTLVGASPLMAALRHRIARESWCVRSVALGRRAAEGIRTR